MNYYFNADHWVALTLLLMAVLWNWAVFPAALFLVLIVAGLIAYRYSDFIYRSYLTLGRDLGGLFLLIRIKLDLNRRLRDNCGVHQIFLDVVRRDPQRLCAIDIATGRRFTFGEVNALANQFANHFQWSGYAPGDVVALYMENCVEFVAAWLGLAKIGVVTAWVNSNLKSQPLAFCLKSSQVKAIICSENLAGVLKSAIDEGYLADFEFKTFSYGRPPPASGDQFVDLRARFETTENNEAAKAEPVSPESVNFQSILCLIYTSGTTGMPKAALIKHLRYYSMAIGSAKSFGIYPTDRIYISLPLYHTSAGIIGVGQVVLQGCSCAIRQRFSASNFWKDCVKYECTASQYIGEICRYLLVQPPIAEERQHRVRLLYGNGLRAEIWQEFVDRFRVKIGEVYGSTEGTSNLVNIDGKVGSCGFLPISPLTSRLHPVRLVRVSDVTGEVIRRADGLCYPCRPGETGAMVSTIRKNNPLLVFEGYLNRTETKKKVIHNVFRPGDSAFLTGDILHWDRLGYLYFKDRTGDTFRWKGENVSTTEVEAVLQPLKCVSDVTVYGVEIPGMEGRAGMAAIARDKVGAENAGSGGAAKSDEEFIADISTLLNASLPAYAIPVFIRLCSAVDKTGTFKLVKTNLRKLGYSSNGAGDDQLYIWELATKRYVPFDASKRAALESGAGGRLL